MNDVSSEGFVDNEKMIVVRENTRLGVGFEGVRSCEQQTNALYYFDHEWGEDVGKTVNIYMIFLGIRTMIIYKTVVRPALLYSADTWATTRGQEARLEVNEMRMLRWMCIVTRRAKIRNEHNRGTTRMVQASKKFAEND